MFHIAHVLKYLVSTVVVLHHVLVDIIFLC